MPRPFSSAAVSSLPSSSLVISVPCTTATAASYEWLHPQLSPFCPLSPSSDPPTSLHPLLGCHPLTYSDLPPSSPSSRTRPAEQLGTTCTRPKRLAVMLLVTALCLVLPCYYAFVLLQARFLHTSLADISWADYSTPELLRQTVPLLSSQQHDEQWLHSQRVVVCGLLRDKEEQVEYVRRALPRITALFADWAVVIVENNSTDSTRDRLLEWQQHDPSHVHVLGSTSSVASTSNSSIVYEPPVHMFRTVQHDYSEWRIRKMVALRNTYLDYVSAHPTLSTYELLVVMDFDLQSFVYIDGLLSTAHHLHSNPAIAAIAANGLQRTTAPATFSLLHGFEYQDPYAHEDGNNAGKAWPQQLDNVRSKFVNRFYYGEPLHPVVSAFGGFTVYRMERLVGKRYIVSHTADGRYVLCEHVSLNRQLRHVDGDGGGGGMYLNPSMIHAILDNTDGYAQRRTKQSTTHPSAATVADSEVIHSSLATS